MNGKILAVLTAGSIGFSSSASADTFKILGTRALGMGGAHVAAAKGGTAQYWNPAALAMDPGVAVEVQAGGGVELTKDLLKRADDLSKLTDKIDAIQAKSGASSFNLSEYRDFLDAVDKIRGLNTPGLGALAEVQGGGEVRLWRFAVSVHNFTEIGADPFVDTIRLGLSGGSFGNGINAVAFDGTVGGNPGVNAADEAKLASVISDVAARVGLDLNVSGLGNSTPAAVANELIFNSGLTSTQVTDLVNQIGQTHQQVKDVLPLSGAAFEDNQTGLDLRGGVVTEAAVGLGTRLPILGGLPLLQRLYVGANAKIMTGRVGYASINVVDEDVELEDLLEKFDRNLKNSADFGLDLGVLYDMKDTFLKSRFGLTARNVNRPSFDQPEAGKAAGLDDLTLDPQVRGGLALYPFNWMTLAADLDLTENSTFLDGYRSRLIGAGAEVNVVNKPWFNLALRAGLLKNVAEDSPMVYTGGLGLNLLHLNVDLGGAVSSERVEIESGEKLPSAARAAANVSFIF